MDTRPRKTRVIVPQGTLYIDGLEPITVSHRLAIGRADERPEVENGVVLLPDPEISSCHCTLDSTGAGIMLEDSGSRNGTFVNEIRILNALLDKDCTIQLGGTRVEFRLGRPRIEVVQDRFGGLLGRSSAMRELFLRLQRAAARDFTVILVGDNGTGKELAARALHDLGPRKEGPFVVVDCATIPTALAESELFGVHRGAFTGAENRMGHFESADGGTIFLDEIGELGVDLQVKLLRVIEEKTIQRVGGTHRRKVNVRIVAATLRNLKAMVNDGRFRRDLYHRLGSEVYLPTLRNHAEDIPLLVEEFCRINNNGSLASAANAYIARRYSNYDWPGNVRELRNAVENFITYGEEADTPKFLPDRQTPSGAFENAASQIEWYRNRTFKDALDLFERDYLAYLYKDCNCVIAEMSRRSGRKRETISKKLKKYHIKT